MRLVGIAACVLVCISALDNGVGLTPQMGWNSWNKFGAAITQHIIYTQAEALKSSGLLALGYKYVLIDDGWEAMHRDSDHVLHADPIRFPDGIKVLVQNIKLLDPAFKVGIYSSAGLKTCAGNHASLGYEQIDARTWEMWGIEYLKYDNCFNQGQSGTPKLSFDRYNAMHDALITANPPIFYSICNWGEDAPWGFAQLIANSWRISGDITTQWDRYNDNCPCLTYDCKLAGYHCSIMNILEKAAPLGQKARIGGWNDLDMLEVGNGALTYDEQVSHFSLWALNKSPLILGNDLTTLTPETLRILGNQHVIAVNQDAKGYAPLRISKTDTMQIWAVALSNNAGAIAFVNTGATAIRKYVHMIKDSLAYVDGAPDLDNLELIAYDLWDDGRVFGRAFSGLGAMQPFDVPVHGTRMFKVQITGVWTPPALAREGKRKSGDIAGADFDVVERHERNVGEGSTK